jgi:hypothetical protein
VAEVHPLKYHLLGEKNKVVVEVWFLWIFSKGIKIKIKKVDEVLMFHLKLNN